MATGDWVAWYCTRLLGLTMPKGAAFWEFSPHGYRKHKGKHKGNRRLTSRAKGATSNSSLSLAFVDGEVTLENTPFSFTMIYSKQQVRVAQCLYHSVPAGALDIPGAIWSSTRHADTCEWSQSLRHRQWLELVCG